MFKRRPTVKCNRALSSEQHSLVSLAPLVGQDGLEETRSVPEDKEEKVLALTPQSVHPAEYLDSLPSELFQLVDLGHSSRGK